MKCSFSDIFIRGKINMLGKMNVRYRCQKCVWNIYWGYRNIIKIEIHLKENISIVEFTLVKTI